jgi:hypothetical protein
MTHRGGKKMVTNTKTQERINFIREIDELMRNKIFNSDKQKSPNTYKDERKEQTVMEKQNHRNQQIPPNNNPKRKWF